MESKIIYQIEDRYIYEINGKILKVGGHNPYEFKMMEYIRKNTSIPVPKVIDNGVKVGKN